MSDTGQNVDRALARFDRVMATIDEREGALATQARRERQRAVSRTARTARNMVIAMLTVSIATIGVGLFIPIGMFGFLAAVLLAAAIAVGIFFWDHKEDAAPPTVPHDASNGEMVQRFDSFLYRTRRALPRPAQAVVDEISGELPPLKSTLERIDAIDPEAQDARRLMSIHLPGLIERYASVPAAYRTEADAEGKTVDQRLVESLEAGRAALSEISERLAQRDRDAFTTQNRFIQTRYGQPTDLPPAS